MTRVALSMDEAVLEQLGGLLRPDDGGEVDCGRILDEYRMERFGASGDDRSPRAARYFQGGAGGREAVSDSGRFS